MLSPKAIIVSACVTSIGLCTVSRADDSTPPFEFSDSYYLENGVDPSTLIGRVDGAEPNSIIDDAFHGPDFTNIRILQTTPVYKHNGDLMFFTVNSFLQLESFTVGEAGDEAFDVAEEFNFYAFPRQIAEEYSVFPKRQEDLADMTGGYFSNDPLGLWKTNLVRYTDAAFNTTDGQEMLAELADENGLDVDGTPVIKTLSELESLYDDGFVSITQRPFDGSGGARWFTCPIIEDPRDGAIAPDAFLAHATNPDGSPAAASIPFIDLFNCLQVTGDDECDGVDGDINGDGTVGVSDLIALLADWGSAGGPADLNQDGIVGVADLIFLLSRWS